ncbi:MAG: hypothetical protein QM702_21390 [Rubrivivax sp.]
MLETPAPCSVASAVSVNPATGRVLVTQAVCQSRDDEGFGYFTSDGQPTEMLFRFGALSPSLNPPRWAADGSLFLFSATDGGASSLYAYIVDQKQARPIIAAGDNRRIESGAVAPDGSAIVDCLRDNVQRTVDLHVLDLTKEPPVDKAITSDGASCDPAF